MQPHRVGGHRGVFDHATLPGNLLFRSGHPIFNARKFTRFEIRKLLLGRRVPLLLRGRRLDLLLWLTLPGVPLRVVGEALRTTASIQSQHAGADPVQHVAVVRHQHQGSAKFQQAFFQDLERRDIKIVGGLIQQQQVGRFQHQPGNQHPRPLAPR